jgi:hypothetical protein
MIELGYQLAFDAIPELEDRGDQADFYHLFYKAFFRQYLQRGGVRSRGTWIIAAPGIVPIATYSLV